MLPPSLKELLKQTSRSFYLTLRVLPRAVRPQISLAYLLARTTDTIADTEIVPVEQRLAALQKLRERILGQSNAPLNFGELANQQGSPAERASLDKVENSLSALRVLSVADLQLVRVVLDTITSGQELDLRRFGERTSAVPAREDARPTPKITTLQNDGELDDYTYRVAGCVGEFWTKMCRTHLFPAASLDERKFLADAIRFGKGLQLVNILRDLPGDLRKGRCYLPMEKLLEVGLQPSDLLATTNEKKFRPLYNRYLDLAKSHLAAGWDYTNMIPNGNARIRLACAWPILFGVKTIARLRAENVLDPDRRIKISRRDVRGIIFRSLICYPWRPAWKKLFTEAAAAGKAVASGAKMA